MLFAAVIAIAMAKQREVVRYAVDEVNQDLVGRLSIGGSHISPFESFPDISIDLEDVRFHATDDTLQQPIYHIEDLYVGFDLWDIVRGRYNIHSLHGEGGFLDLVQHPDGSLNLLVAKNMGDTTASDTSAFHLDLSDVRLRNFTFSHHHEGTGKHVEARIDELWAVLFMANGTIGADVLGDLHMDVYGHTENNFFHNKHVELDVHLDFNEDTRMLEMPPSTVILQAVEFNAEGTIDLQHDVDMDLHVHGEKPDFSLLTAFAPEDVAEFLAQFRNAGTIAFDGTVKGRSAHGMTPRVDIRFDCADGYFENTHTSRKVDQLAFKGSFTNGGDPTLKAAEFHLRDFHLRPGSGDFSGDVIVKDFTSPHVDVDLHCDLDLGYVGEFLNVEILNQVGGHVQVDMKLIELIDIEQPELNLARLKQGIDSDLRIRDLHFRIPGHPHAVDDLDVHAQMRQGFVEIDTFRLRMAKSDLKLSGSISDLPAIFHHTQKPVELKLAVESHQLIMRELLAFDTAMARTQHEELTGLSGHMRFVTSVNDLLDHEPLPLGEFFIDDLTVKAKHYPHRLHDVHADVIITDSTLRIADLTGTIDQSDIHFDGLVKDYGLWFTERKQGETHVAIDFRSQQLILHDLLTYKEENFLPPEYRDEVLREARFHADADLRFTDNAFRSADLRLQKLTGKMNVHPLKLEDFHGHLHVEDEVLTLDDMAGRMGRTDIACDLRLFLGKDPAARQAPDRLDLRAAFLDLDAMMNYRTEKEVDHDSAFNIFSLPFPDLELLTDIGTLKYHRYELKDFRTRLHLKPDHTLQVDTLSTRIAQGSIGLRGSFTAKDPSTSYSRANWRRTTLTWTR